MGFLGRFLEGKSLEALGRDASAVFRASLDDPYPDPLSRSMAELGRPDPDAALPLAEQHGGKVFVAQVLLLQGTEASCQRGLRLAHEAGAIPLECELGIRLEALAGQPSAERLAKWREKARASGLRGAAQRARLAIAAYRLKDGSGERGIGEPVLPPAELQLDLIARTLTAFGQDIPILRRKTITAVLRALMLAYPEPRSQKELYQEAWDQPYQEQDSDAAVRKAISQLRDLLEPDRARPRVILVREGGYGLKGGYVLGVSFALLEKFFPGE